MAEISASDVMKLRKMSGQGMMDCKVALTEAKGDIEEAMSILRKKGLATLAKRAGRDTSEGKIVFVRDGNIAVLAALCCETDFVSKSDDFAATAEIMKKYMVVCSAEQGADALANTVVDGRKFSEVITDCVSKTGEKIEVGEYAKYICNSDSVIGTYIHFNNKVGAMIEIQACDAKVAGNSDINTLANDITMHITACKPIAVDRTAVDKDTIEKERAIAAEQVKNKPANIIEKIVDGKINKFFEDSCLVDQSFVKNEDVKVGKLLEETAKKAGGTAKIKRFVRFEIS